MAYKLRDRKKKQIYIDLSSSSDSESDLNIFNDPDYSSKPERQEQQQQQQEPQLQKKYNTRQERIVGICGLNNDRNNNNNNNNNNNFSNIFTSTRQTILASTNTNSNTNTNVGTNIGTRGRRRAGRPRKSSDVVENQETVLGHNGKQDTIKRKRKRRRRRAQYSLRKRTLVTEKEERRTVLALLVDLDIVKENEQVHYLDMKQEKITLEGEITRAGILCKCCGNVVTAQDFEVHAGPNGGDEDRPKPYENIVLARNGATLLQCQVKAWYRGMYLGYSCVFNHVEPKKTAMDKSDDACLVCADGGDLICCEKCPSTFHVNCLNMKRVPLGDWLCPYCVCKYCGLSGGVHNKDCSKCSLCEKTYHWACYAQKELNLNSSCSLFCGQSCNEVYDKLQRFLGVKNQLDGGFSWRLVRHRDILSNEVVENNFYQIVECNSKIAVTWTVMDQSFETIVDRHTKINVVRSVVFNAGSNVSRINFKGFYTAILEKDDEVISVASLRLHGTKMAEMPFVATQRSYRGKGMLKKLLVAIESVLCYLEVENLVIPSAEDVVGMWINKFHFSLIIDKSLAKDIVLSNMLMFPKAVRLQKNLLPNTSKTIFPESSEFKRAVPFDLNLEPPQEDKNT